MFGHAWRNRFIGKAREMPRLHHFGHSKSMEISPSYCLMFHLTIGISKSLLKNQKIIIKVLSLCSDDYGGIYY